MQAGISGRIALAVVLVAPCLCDSRAYAQDGQTFKTVTAAVPVYVSVTTRDGQPVRDLTKDDFEVFDDGSRRPIQVFSAEVQPLTVATVLDRSNSNFGQLPWATKGVEAFISTMRSSDRLSISTLENLVLPMTSDRQALLNRIGGTLPNDAASWIWLAVQRSALTLINEPQRRIVLLLSDGLDAGSPIQLQELRETSERFLISFYAVEWSRPINFRVTLTDWERQRDKAREQLTSVVRQSGGEMFLLRDGAYSVQEAFTRIAEGLRNHYLIGFESPFRDGAVHKLEIKVKKKDVLVRTRSSYLADTPKGDQHRRRLNRATR